MSRGYRLAIIALGLTLFAYQGHSQEAKEPALESQPVAEEGQPERASTGEEITAPEQQDTSSLIPAIQGVETAVRDLVAAQNQGKDADEIQRQKDDLDAQERMALWAMWMFIAALGSVFFTGAGVILIWRTLHHTRRAADYANDMVREAHLTTKAADETVRVTKEIGERELRPWVSLDFDVISWKWRTENAGSLSINLTAKNVGKSVALYVSATTYAYDLETDWDTGGKYARDDLLGISGKMQWPKGNGALLPSETQYFRSGCGFNFPPQMANMRDGKKVFMPHFLLFCRYFDSAGNEYFTQRAVRLRTKSEGEGFIAFDCDELGPDDFIKEAIGPSMAT